jgi:predicted TIM-barrel fold metal-dependent hydrolase
MSMPANKRHPTDLPFILDAHCHMGYFRNFHIPKNDADGMVEVMDQLGVDMVAVAHHAGISSDFRLGNDETAEAIARYPDRVIGYCVINPNFPGEVEAELHRRFAVPGFRGIKVHPELHGDYPLDGPNYRPMWEFANRLRIPLLSHTYFAGDSHRVFDRLAETYPNVPILLGHSGLDLGLEGSIALANRQPNIILDLCGPLTWNGVVELLVRSVEVEQIIFGSDMPFTNAAQQLGGLVMARVRRDYIEKIAGSNAARLFGIEPSTQRPIEAIL